MTGGQGRRSEAIPPWVRQDSAIAPRSHKLMEDCQGLVRSLAWKIHRKLPPQVDLEDLISFGQVGLAEAARDFDPDRGGKFTTYAYYRIRGAILDGLSKMSWFSRHSFHASRYEHSAEELIEFGTEEGGEGPPARLEDGVRWFKGVAGRLAIACLATPRGVEDGDGFDGGASVVDESAPSPSALAIENEIREKLHKLIETLPSDAGTLVRGVYFEGLTLEEAGKRVGISKAWASRLHAKTLDRLAHALRLLGVDGG